MQAYKCVQFNNCTLEPAYRLGKLTKKFNSKSQTHEMFLDMKCRFHKQTNIHHDTLHLFSTLKVLYTSNHPIHEKLSKKMYFLQSGGPA